MASADRGVYDPETIEMLKDVLEEAWAALTPQQQVIPVALSWPNGFSKQPHSGSATPHGCEHALISIVDVESPPTAPNPIKV